MRGFPSLVKGAGLRTPWRRPAWVQIPPPAPEINYKGVNRIYENVAMNPIRLKAACVIIAGNKDFEVLRR